MKATGVHLTFETLCLLNLMLTKLFKAREICLSLLFSNAGLTSNSTISSFFYRYWDLNSGPLDFTASTLSPLNQLPAQRFLNGVEKMTSAFLLQTYHCVTYRQILLKDQLTGIPSSCCLVGWFVGWLGVFETEFNRVAKAAFIFIL